MKNNVLSAFVVFFAVVACLLIIDDLSHNSNKSSVDASEVNAKPNQQNSDSFATLDFKAKE
ncbi:hypothetical protein [Winogradskyella jejuensis]|uniref:Uncharacterized protein n=1 Tax=Winogradskyella jejuensis TaxID=1089305 RepID=A0A1M5NPE1_9FLAO|nr:hypothetical protein [Winogradskyella jejuensis]SHG91421.1 hypothetical protein SAMN05444148_1262 [Winogradskyella jejuensis]